MKRWRVRRRCCVGGAAAAAVRRAEQAVQRRHAGHHGDSVTIGSHYPLTGPGGARLQRDRAGGEGVLHLRQRQRRRQRTQDQLHLPGRRLQPDQDRHGRQAARPAGQGRSRSSAASARPPTPRWSTSSTRRRCPTCSCPPAACAGTSPASTPRRSAGSPTTRRGQDPRPVRRSRTSRRARRSPTSPRTTTSARTATSGLDQYIPKERGRRRQVYQPGNTDVGPQIAAIKASGAAGGGELHDPGLHRAGRADGGSSSATTRSWSRATSASTR